MPLESIRMLYINVIACYILCLKYHATNFKQSIMQKIYGLINIIYI